MSRQTQIVEILLKSNLDQATKTALQSLLPPKVSATPPFDTRTMS